MSTIRLKRTVWATGFAILLSLVPYSAQAKTGANLILDLRVMLGQTTASNSNWTDAELYQCLNLAQDYITGIGRVVEKSDTLAGGSLRISYPADYMQLRNGPWLWRNGKEVRPLPVVALDSMYKLLARNSSQVVGLDNYYVADEGSKLIVAPPLSSSDSVVIQYYARPDTLDSTTECGFNPEWERVLLVDAKALALQKTRDVNWYDRAIAERDNMVAALYQQTKQKPQLNAVP